MLVKVDLFGINSRDLLQKFQDCKIQTRPLWQPIHLSPAHLGNQTFQHPVAEQLNREALSLPCSVGLSAEDQQRVIDVIRSIAG